MAHRRGRGARADLGRRSNIEIARELELSLKTVQNHISNVLAKLQVRARTYAALRARGF